MENYKEMQLGFILYFHLLNLKCIMVAFAQTEQEKKGILNLNIFFPLPMQGKQI